MEVSNKMFQMPGGRPQLFNINSAVLNVFILRLVYESVNLKLTPALVLAVGKVVDTKGCVTTRS